jgi:hypothetical protein
MKRRFTFLHQQKGKGKLTCSFAVSGGRAILVIDANDHSSATFAGKSRSGFLRDSCSL